MLFFLGLEQGHSADRDQWRQETGAGNLLTRAPLLQGKEVFAVTDPGFPLGVANSKGGADLLF